MQSGQRVAHSAFNTDLRSDKATHFFRETFPRRPVDSNGLREAIEALNPGPMRTVKPTLTDLGGGGRLEADASVEAESKWAVVTHSPLIMAREKPHARSAAIPGSGFLLGRPVQLHESDESGAWRRVKVQLNGKATSGWLPVEHPVLGRLVRFSEIWELEPRRSVGNGADDDRALMDAVHRHDLPAVQRLLNQGANSARTSSVAEYLPCEAVSSGDASIVAMFLMHSRDPRNKSAASMAKLGLRKHFSELNGARRASRGSLAAGVLIDLFQGEKVPLKARRAALAELPVEIARPVIWTLQQSGIYTREEAEAEVLESLRAAEGAGAPSGLGWELRRAPPSLSLEATESSTCRTQVEPLLLPLPMGSAPSCGSTSRKEGLRRYMVTFSPFIAVRSAPYSGKVLCTRARGKVLELFESPGVGAWRRCVVGDKVASGREAWVPLEHPALGPLLEPLRGDDRAPAQGAQAPPRLKSVGAEIQTVNLSVDRMLDEYSDKLKEGELARAVRKQNLMGVLGCLAEGEDPNARNVLGDTPLFEAVASSHMEILAALLLYHADLNIANSDGVVCSDKIEDPHARTLVDMFEGVEVDEEAASHALSLIYKPALRLRVLKELGRC